MVILELMEITALKGQAAIQDMAGAERGEGCIWNPRFWLLASDKKSELARQKEQALVEEMEETAAFAWITIPAISAELARREAPAPIPATLHLFRAASGPTLLTRLLIIRPRPKAAILPIPLKPTASDSRQPWD